MSYNSALLSFQIKVNAIVLAEGATRGPGQPPRHSGHGVFTHPELQELARAFDAGWTPEQFAEMIQTRDRAGVS